MSAKLQIAPGFALPLEATTETFAILAKRGKGKTYTGSVLAEELLEHGQQVVIVDPLDVWWGLRAGAKGGKSGGLPIVIFGGKHADVPLDEHMGETVADLVVDRKISCVLVLDGWSKAAMRRFVTDFGERLYARSKTPVHLVLDEADIFAAQRIGKGDERMFAAIDNLVRRGRSKGVGVTLISQRAAVIHKDVLTQTEILIAMGVTSKQDRAAIEGWLEANATSKELDEILGSLAGLDVGEAWIYSPTLIGELKRVHIRQRRTFDSSATPKVGEKRPAAAAHLRDVDLAKLRDELGEVLERKKDEDPKLLRERIHELERELKTQPRARTAAAPAVNPAKEVERAHAASTRENEKRIRELQRAHQDELAAIEQRLAAEISRSSAAIEALARTQESQLVDAQHLLDVLKRIDQDRSLKRAETKLERARAATKEISATPAPAPPRPRSANPANPAAAATMSTRSSTTRTTTTSTRLRDLTPPLRALLSMARLAAIGEAEPDKDLVAVFAGYEPGGSTMRAIFAGLSKEGLVEYVGQGQAKLTPAGAAAAPRVDAPATFEALRELLESERLLNGPQLQAFDIIAGKYPSELTKEDLGAALVHEPGGSTQRAVLARLRALRLIEKGPIKAQEWIFMGRRA